MGSIRCLYRVLSKNFTAPCERAEKLIVEVVSIRDHDDRRVPHLWMEHELPGEERHREALAAPCVCQTTPPCFLPSGFDAATTLSIARWVAWNWW